MIRRREKWRLVFNRSIIGWVLIAARKQGSIVLRGAQIPARVREYAMVDERGIVTDNATRDVLSEKSGGAPDVAIREEIPAALTGWRAETPPQLDVDDAEYVGNETDGVYFKALKQGATWWAVTLVDSDTGHFVDTLFAEGGYRNEKRARAAAMDAATDWCLTNGVNLDDATEA